MAVVVNPRAQRVGGRLLQLLLRHVPPDALYMCEQLSELDRLVPALLHAHIDIIACMGGDGTLAAVMERMCAAKSAALPPIAVLPSGTGNALAHWVAKPTFGSTLRALRRLRRGTPWPTRPLALIAEGPGDGTTRLAAHDAHRRFFFGGMGIDSLLLADYNRVRNAARSQLGALAVHGLPGYAQATLRYTLPALRKEPRPLLATIKTHQEAHFFDGTRGDATTPIAPGTTLWRGPLSLVAVGTAPTFGYGLRMFPFAAALGERTPPHMQLRLATLSPFEVLRHLPQIWRGRLRHSGLLDFAVRDISIELAEPFVWQTSGDERGMAQSLHLRVAPEVLSLIDLRAEATPR